MKKFFASAAMLCTLGLTTVVLNSCDNGNDPVTPVDPSTVKVDPNNFAINLKSGDILELNAGTTYYMKGAVIVGDGAKLTIPAGTKIVCSGGTNTYLAVAQGGQIFANGTSTSPIVFESPTKQKGDWGGIVICGRASINTGATGRSEVADLPYGGTNDADNSGVLKYVVINNSGARFSDTKEYNGISFFGVGNGTTVEGIAAINGADDGIEFFGGTVNVKNMVSYNNDDDAFDWTDGWRGTAENVYGKRIAANVGNMGIEADNQKSNNDANPRSNPTLKNITLIGYTTTDNEGDGTNVFRVGTYATIDNMVVSGWKTGLTFKDASTIAYFNQAGKIKNVKFDNVGAKVAGIDAALVAGMENPNATGAGDGVNLPSWAKGWSGIN